MLVLKEQLLSRGESQVKRRPLSERENAQKQKTGCYRGRERATRIPPNVYEAVSTYLNLAGAFLGKMRNEKLFRRPFVQMYPRNILYLIASRQHVPLGPCRELKLERSNKERGSWVLFAFSSGRGGFLIYK